LPQIVKKSEAYCSIIHTFADVVVCFDGCDIRYLRRCALKKCTRLLRS
jgi:hypothetical protein